MNNLETIFLTLFVLYWTYWVTIAVIYRKRIDPLYIVFIAPFAPIVSICEWLIIPVEKK